MTKHTPTPCSSVTHIPPIDNWPRNVWGVAMSIPEIEHEKNIILTINLPHYRGHLKGTYKWTCEGDSIARRGIASNEKRLAQLDEALAKAKENSR